MAEVPEGFPRLDKSEGRDAGSVPCGCGCGLIGTPRRKPMKDGLTHVHRCRCKRCTGGRVRKTGLNKQGIARKALGITVPFRNQLSDEENWRAALRVEVKSQGAASPVVTRFRAARDQSDANKAIGDPRPFAACFMGEGSHGVFACALSDLPNVVTALLDIWGDA